VYVALIQLFLLQRSALPEEHHPHEPHVNIHAGGLVLDTHPDPAGKSGHNELLRSETLQNKKIRKV
jgi:hypothetical protein